MGLALGELQDDRQAQRIDQCVVLGGQAAARVASLPYRKLNQTSANSGIPFMGW
jgi:pyrrolidone-carboxylate peptidase